MAVFFNILPIGFADGLDMNCEKMKGTQKRLFSPNNWVNVVPFTEMAKIAGEAHL